MSRAKDVLDTTREEIERAADAVRGKCALSPRVAMILGSGLGGYADSFEEATRVDYAEIPGFLVSTVPGHAGRLVLGTRRGVPVVAQQGRFHVYEGYPASRITFPLRVMHALGARILFVTNAAGGIDPLLAPGDLMLIEDHMHLQFRSPLRGRGPLVDRDRFVDLSEPYSKRLLAAALEAAGSLGLSRIRMGTYGCLTGPSYETPAEVRALRLLGADAVGMSTVPEVLVARHLGMEVLGVSCVTNLAAGVSKDPIAHDEVIEVTRKAGIRFAQLLDALLDKI